MAASDKACQALRLSVDFALGNQASYAAVLVPCNGGWAPSPHLC